jgi:hypothetical protein
MLYMLSFTDTQRDIYIGQKYLLGGNKDIGTDVKTIRIRKKEKHGGNDRQ